ncbi:MAG: polyprenyl synthetase family protein, partial [candidate division WOR-3 bacterium]
EKVLPTACAIEFIHSFSLIHDDLPALDNDLLRRGRPTCHVQFGEALALLAGDALFASAFELIALQTQLSPPERVVQVLQLIARASGTHGMVGGQVEDILSEGKEVSPATLEYIHTHKTGALIQAAVMAGAILAGGEESSLQALARYGAAFGHAFQIIDDILNEVGSEAKLGKSVGSDRQRMKATYPRLLGLEASWQAAEQKTQEALQALQPFEERADPLRWIALSVLCQELE